MMSSDQSKAQIGKTQLEIQLSETTRLYFSGRNHITYLLFYYYCEINENCLGPIINRRSLISPSLDRF